MPHPGVSDASASWCPKAIDPEFLLIDPLQFSSVSYALLLNSYRVTFPVIQISVKDLDATETYYHLQPTLG